MIAAFAVALAFVQDHVEYRPPQELETIQWPAAPRPSRPQRGYLGITPDRQWGGPGIRVGEVADGGPADEAGVEPGDILVGLADHGLEEYRDLLGALGACRPGDRVPLGVARGDEDLALEVTLGDPGTMFALSTWSRPEFHLALVLVEFPDQRHNDAVPVAEYQKMLFSRGEYVGPNACGEEVYGSLADYYAENSGGRLSVTGRAFDWVCVDRPRAELERMSLGGRAFRDDFLQAALRRVRDREGENALDEFDGVIVLYAGAQSHYRPRALWPHRASLRLGSRTVPYYLAAEGGDRIGAIGVHVHEFGHMLGLPDQYGRRHSTGIGKWCVMAVGHMGGGESRNHRPYELCAWCKMRLGWVTCVDVDPRAEQAAKLGPVERDRQVIRLLAREDGTDYYLLENRERIGFDADLDAPGLLVWHVTERGRGAGVDLVEGHGIAVENASLVETEEIPFPNVYNEHFTPDTRPSSRVEGGVDVYVTRIERDGETVYFRLGERLDARSWEPPIGGFH